MKASGSSEPDILVLGEAPGEEEDHQGKAFVGPAGKMLRKIIPERQLDRIAFQNIVRCRTPENRNPTAQEIYACSIYLEADIDKLKPKAILGVGALPLSQHISDTTITRAHGLKMPVRIADRTMWYFPILHPSFVIQAGGESGSIYPVLRADVKRFFSEIDTWRRPTIMEFKEESIRLLNTESEVRAAFEKLQEPFAVDVETDGLKPFRGNPVLSAACTDTNGTFAFSCLHPQQVNKWAWPLLLEIVQKRRWIAHNCSMEMLWFWYAIGDKWNPTKFEDTMALARVNDERETVLGLAHQSRLHLGVNVKSFSNLDVKRLKDYPIRDVLIYNGFDTQATFPIYQELSGHVSPRLYERLLATSKSFVAMEIAGLPVDVVEARELQKKLEGKEKDYTQKAKELYEVKEWERRTQIEFNIASNDHVGAVLVDIVRIDLPGTTDKNGKKRYSTGEDILTPFADRTPLIPHILDYRAVTKLKGTYVDPIADGELQGNDGYIHPSYNSMLVSTLRGSCDGPNAQNYPKRKHREVRREVVPEKDHIIVAIDFASLQGRIAGMASRDGNLIDKFIANYDLHADWRDRLLSSYPEWMDRIRGRSGETAEKALLKAARNMIKQDFVFHSLFGGTARGASERTGVPEPKMVKLQAEFWEEFPDMHSWIKAKRSEYRDTGGVTLMSGLRRHAIMPGNEVVNNPIQNGEAEIVMAAQAELCELAYSEKDKYFLPRINVHDDLTFILPDNEEKLEYYIPRIADVMIKPRFNWIIIPLVVEVSIGYNWCDLEDDIAKYTGDYHK